MYSVILLMNVLAIIFTMNHQLFALPPSISVSHVRWLTRAHYYRKRDKLVYRRRFMYIDFRGGITGTLSFRGGDW